MSFGNLVGFSFSFSFPHIKLLETEDDNGFSRRSGRQHGGTEQACKLGLKTEALTLGLEGPGFRVKYNQFLTVYLESRFGYPTFIVSYVLISQDTVLMAPSKCSKIGYSLKPAPFC